MQKKLKRENVVLGFYVDVDHVGIRSFQERKDYVIVVSASLYTAHCGIWGYMWKFRCYENHDLAIARSSSSRADPGLRVAFKCSNI